MILAGISGEVDVMVNSSYRSECSKCAGVPAQPRKPHANNEQT